MNRHAVALGDKADDIVAGNGRTAAAILDGTGADILDDDAGARRRLGLLLLAEGEQLLRRHIAAGLGQLVAHAAHGLRRGQAAVADGGVHIVEAVEADALEHHGPDVVLLQNGRIDANVPQLGFEAQLAARDVLLALFLLEPLLDLDARLV